jgi:O-antigen/teichoic acid export membrane protein
MPLLKSNMLKKIKLNALSGYLNFAVTSCLVFFISPLLIKFLGDSIFGIWKSIQKILTFASIADGKSTQALKWVVANDESQSNIKVKQQAVGSALRIWFYFLPFVILIVIILVYKLPSLINDLDPSLYSVLYQAGFILGANILLNPLLKIPDAILVGTNNGYKSNFIQIFGAIVSNLLMLLSSSLGYGLIGLSFVVLIVTLFNALFIFWICKKSISWLGIQKPTKIQVNEFFQFSFWVFLWSFVMKLILASEILLIGYLISSEMVTNYVFSAYLIQLAVSFGLLTGSAITPSLGNLIGANEMKKSKVIVVALRDFINLIALFFGSIVILINKDFVGLWMGESYYLGHYANLLIVFTMVFLVLARIEGQIQDLTLNIKNKVITGLLVSAISVAFGFFGFYFLENIEGIFLGILIGRILMYISFNYMVNQFTKLKPNYFKCFCVILILTMLSQIVEFIPTVNSWFSLMFKLITISFIILPIYFLILLSKSSKNTVKIYLKK